jgi:hypothetical protein
MQPDGIISVPNEVTVQSKNLIFAGDNLQDSSAKVLSQRRFRWLIYIYIYIYICYRQNVKSRHCIKDLGVVSVQWRLSYNPGNVYIQYIYCWLWRSKQMFSVTVFEWRAISYYFGFRIEQEGEGACRSLPCFVSFCTSLLACPCSGCLYFFSVVT